MTDNEKAEQILYALMRICPSRNVVLLQVDDVLKKCGSAEELNFSTRNYAEGIIDDPETEKP